MKTRSPTRTLSQLAHIPLFAALALTLGTSFARPSIDAGAPLAGPAGLPGTRSGLHLGDQRAALDAQIRRRGTPASTIPNRAAGAIVVSNCEDSGAGSLRDAFLNAVSGDVIDLTQLDCSTITLATGLTTNVDDLTLTGPGAGQLAIDGNNQSRVVEHLGYGMLTLDGLTIRNGSYTYSGPGIYGGLAPGACVLSRFSVTISNSVIDHCSASGWSVFGGAINAGGAVYLVDSTVSGTTSTAKASEISATAYGGVVYAKAAYLTRSTIDGAEVVANSTASFSGLLGGGVFGFYGVVMDQSRVSGVNAHVSGAKISYAKGGGVATPNTVILTDSTVSGNSVHGTPGVGLSGPYVYTSAIGGGGVYIMAIPRSVTPPSFITNSTISANAAICDGDPGEYTVGGGGGIGSWAIRPVTITNSTISGNSACTHGGGLYTRHLGALVLANSTVTDNTAPDGAGIADLGGDSFYDLVLNSSIVAGNHLPGGAPLAEVVTVHAISGANNLVASANAALPGDTIDGDPLLGPLADNGGLTWTHALLAGSPAIDTGNNLASLTTDQRGEGYARTDGAATDIGAYERQAVSDPIFANGFD